jgi:hypothetical protein
MAGEIDVLIIGTDPPCPRCDLLHLLVEQQAAAVGRPVAVRHCAYDSEEAAAVGRRFGRWVGTAKHVAEQACIAMDWDAVRGLIDNSRSPEAPTSRPAEAWTPELDAMLDACRAAADEAGFLMTPVLLVHGEVKHHGSVPRRAQIELWLRSA